MARARAAAHVHEEAVSHVRGSASGRAEALLEYGCEEPVDLLLHDVPSAPRDVESSAPRAVADVLIGDHMDVCPSCRTAGYAHLGRGLPQLTRESAARRSVAWLSLCPEGKQIFVASWTALGLSLPEYAREPA